MTEKPKSFSIKPDGTMSMKIAPDGSITASSDKPVTLDLGTIKSVSVENLIDVEVHEINRVFNSTSHYIKFFGGGEVRFSYNSKGQLIELSGKEVLTTIKNGDQVVFSRRSASKSSNSEKP